MKATDHDLDVVVPPTIASLLFGATPTPMPDTNTASARHVTTFRMAGLTATASRQWAYPLKC